MLSFIKLVETIELKYVGETTAEECRKRLCLSSLINSSIPSKSDRQCLGTRQSIKYRLIEVNVDI